MISIKINIPKGFMVKSFDEKTGEVSFEEVPKDFKDRIKTFDDALQWRQQSRDVKGRLDELEKQLLFDYKGRNKRIISQQAYLKLTIIAEALNEGWFPDWTNPNECKYYPWFKYTSGVDFSYYGYNRDFTNTDVGSRICFKSRELAEYAGKQFQDIYNDFLS